MAEHEQKLVFDKLAAASFRLLKASESSISKNEKLQDNISKKIMILDVTVDHIDKKISSALNDATEKAVNKMFGNVITQLNSAEQQAAKTADKYRTLAKYSILKICLIIYGLLIATIAAFWYGLGPTDRNLHELLSEQHELQKNVEYLRQFGEINSCDDKPCIKIEPAQSYFLGNDTYYIISPN